MNQKLVIERLNKEAKIDKALDAFLHVCALRQRARGSITIHGMSLRMKNSGFDFDRSDYQRILGLLGDLAVGTPVKDSKGFTVALKDIKVSLQSLGKAALGESSKVSSYNKRTLYKTVSAAMPNTVAAPVEVTKAPVYGSGAESARSKGFPVSITVLINGKPVNFRVDPSLDTSEIAEVIARFRDHGWDKEL